MKQEAIFRRAAELEAGLAGEFEEISHYIFTHPELGLMEKESCRYLTEYLRSKGFTVETPYAGLETAFRAEFGSGDGPTIAMLAEYDALPGFGPDKLPAHACGHNWIAANCVGTAVVLSRMADMWNGRIAVIGTPAEETFGGKVHMVGQGVFKTTDVCMQIHAGAKTDMDKKALAMNSMIFVFHGKASHAAASPEAGINALDAVQLTFAGINALRQHVKSDVRIHGIVVEGGTAANVVPDRASANFYVRAAERAYLDTVIEHVINVAKGAALMTGCTLDIEYPELPFDNMVNLPALQSLGEKYLRLSGVDFVRPAPDKIPLSGSSDVGNVSYVCPTFYMSLGFDTDIPFHLHEEDALPLIDSPVGNKALHQAITTLCGMSLELFARPELLAKVRDEFAAAL